jgi:hypothetical protein
VIERHATVRVASLGCILALVAVACGGGPSPSTAPSGLTTLPSLTPAALASGRTGWPSALVVHAVAPHVGASPNGPPLSFDVTGQPELILPGRHVTITSDAVAGPDGPWLHAWLGETPQLTWPFGFFAWYPVSALQDDPPVACPPSATLAALAALGAFDRARCAGITEITLDARSGRLPAAPLYDTVPAWYGTNAEPGLAVWDPGEVRIGLGAILSAETAGAWLEARVPPGVDPIPVGFYVRVHGHYSDPSAAGCTRKLAAAQGLPSEPIEAASDSATWCASQLVVTGWEPLLGPEGRPIDPSAPQLHRREYVVPPGAVEACGGVGMDTLTVRIDPGAIDPVWIESGPRHRRSVATFANAFRLSLDPLGVVATNGVTLLNGERLDPDRGKAGLWLCPGGDTIWFDIPH